MTGSPDGPGLRRMQEIFWGLITGPEGVRPAVDDLVGRGLLEAPGLDGLFVGDDRLTSVERLDIYANMYFFRLLDCLAEDFPKVRAALGPERFHNLVTDYVLRHPSRHPSLRHLGGRLPAFVAAHPIAVERPWLPDLARLVSAQRRARSGFQGRDPGERRCGRRLLRVRDGGR